MGAHKFNKTDQSGETNTLVNTANGVKEPLLLRSAFELSERLCDRHFRLPQNSNRVSEGGLRLAGHTKHGSPERPLVTVITVVYNRVNTLEQCMLSVFRQTYENIEYIVIDGGSDDGTVELIERYLDSIDYFVSEPDSGIYDAMNKGISLSSGDYILLLNSDDWYREDAIEQLVDAANKSGAEIIHADATAVDKDGRFTGTLDGWLHAGLYTSGNLVRHETMLVKREVYDRFGGYDPSFRIIADYLFIIQLYHAGCHFEHVPERLLYFRETGVSNSNHEQRLFERSQLFGRLFPFLEEQDLSRLTKGRLTNAEMVNLMDKYKNTSEVFIRSLAFNIAASPSFRVSQVIFSLATWLRKTPVWYMSGSIRRWLHRRLPR